MPRHAVAGEISNGEIALGFRLARLRRLHQQLVRRLHLLRRRAGVRLRARVGVRVMRGLLNCAKAALFITSSQTPSQPLGGGKPQYRGRWCVCKRSRQRGRAPLSHVPIQRLALEALHPQEARQCLKNGRETAAVYLAMQPCTWSPPQAHTQRAHTTHKVGGRNAACLFDLFVARIVVTNDAHCMVLKGPVLMTKGHALAEHARNNHQPQRQQQAGR